MKKIKKIDLNITANEEKGTLQLSAIWDDHKHSLVDIKIVDGDVVEMFCPHCNESLICEDICEHCGATTTMLRFSEGCIKICNRKGCNWHLRFLLSG